MCYIPNCFIYRPSDSTVSEDAGIEPRTFATLAFAVRCSNNLARSHPQTAGSNPTTWLDLIHRYLKVRYRCEFVFCNAKESSITVYCRQCVIMTKILSKFKKERKNMRISKRM